MVLGATHQQNQQTLHVKPVEFTHHPSWEIDILHTWSDFVGGSEYKLQSNTKTSVIQPNSPQSLRYSSPNTYFVMQMKNTIQIVICN